MVSLREVFKQQKSKLTQLFEKKERKIVKKERDQVGSITFYDPLFVTRINFEIFKSIFKHDIKISKASKDSGHIDEKNFKIERFREMNNIELLNKSIDSMRILDNEHNRKYADMVERDAYGMNTVTKNGFIYFNYNMQQIEHDIIKNREKKDD